MRSLRVRILAALVLLAAPIATAVVVLFAGGYVQRCLSTRCPQVVIEPWIAAATPGGLLTLLLVYLAIWLAVATTVIGWLWAHDRRRLVWSSAVVCGIGLGVGAFVGCQRIVDGLGRRTAVEDAVLYAAVAVAIAIPLILAGATVTARRRAAGEHR
jgi:hypothetical protein